jgi:formylglycine-generating enzyme required for sulfatase activity
MKYYKNMLVLLLTIVMSMITGCTTTTNRDKSSADNKEAAVETTDRAKEKNALSPRMVLIPANPDFVFDSSLGYTTVSDAGAVAAVNAKYGTSYISGTDIYGVKDTNADHWALYCNTKRTGEASPIMNSYYMNAYFITNREWKAFCDATGHPYPGYWSRKEWGTLSGVSTSGTEIFLPKFEDKLDHPVMSISCTDVTAYCQWYEKQHPGWFFRLPTSAEWENAARGGQVGITYPWGYNTPTYTYNPDTKKGSGTIYELAAYSGYMAANLIDMYGYDYAVTVSGKSYKLGELLQIKNGAVSNWSAEGVHFTNSSLYRLWSSGAGGLTTPVGKFKANSYGLYDMVGNCWTLTSTHMTGIFGPELGMDCVSVRGGSYYAQMASLRISFRRETRDFSAGSATVGARLAAEEIGKEVIVNYNLNSGATSIVYQRALTIDNRAVKDGIAPEYLYSPTGREVNGATPVKLLVLDGWYDDEACTKKFDFNLKVTSALNLYGKWIDSGKTGSYIANTGKLVVNS